MNRTNIEWTTFSANPLKYRDQSGRVVWGCVHASPGCLHCYSESIAQRYRRGGPFNVPTMNTLTPFLDEKELHHMRTAKRIDGIEVADKMCFIGDMTDIFGEWVPDDLLIDLFDTFRQRPEVTWQILTKRALRMRDFCSRLRFDNSSFKGRTFLVDDPTERRGYPLFPQFGASGMSWVWLGVSVEDQERANERIPLLLQTPAAVRFISAEPLLGPINLESIPLPGPGCEYYGLRGVAQPTTEKDTEPDDWKYWTRREAKLDWVIVGGESGHRARPCAMEWIESIVQQCQAASVPVFCKQMGSVWAKARQADSKGGDPQFWPEHVRVREFPNAA